MCAGEDHRMIELWTFEFGKYKVAGETFARQQTAAVTETAAHQYMQQASEYQH